VAQVYVLSLDNWRATVETVGGKGASLTRLLRAGVPVPGGFHVTTAAYESSLPRRIWRAASVLLCR
jgi:phosphoenolpyruvate synthase/pyruvate phosphate dikinase